MNYEIMFNKLCLFTVEAYFSRAISEGLSEDPFHKEVQNAINGYLTFGRYSTEERDVIIALGKEEAFKKITHKQISFIVFGLELLKAWVELIPKKNRPHLNISDKRLKVGRTQFVLTMVKLKNEDREKYDELKSIIDDSVITAKLFIGYAHRRLVEEHMSV